jgi:autotransporter-associated beta strand protein
VFALTFCAPPSAQAVTKAWDGGSTTGDWNLQNNWDLNGLPVSGDDVLFDSSLQTPLEDIFLNAAQSINTLTINLTAGANQSWNLGADNGTSGFTLTLATGNISVLSTSGTGTYIIGATSGGSGIGTGIMTLATTATGFTFDNSRSNGGLLQIDAIVSGAKTVTKTGAGTVSLTGVNTYTGGTTINGGTLIANNAASLGATSGALTVNAGTVEIATGFTTTRNITLGSIASTFQIDPSQTYTTTGVVSSTGALNKTGTGTMVLSGANTYTGATTVSAGTLKAGLASVANTSGAFGNNSAVTLANTSGVALDITGFNTQIGSLTGGGATGGNITLGAATLTTGGNNTSPAAYAGVISGTGGVTKIGTGTQILSGANTFGGATTINGGTLTLATSSGSALGSTSAITVNSGGTLLLGANNQISIAATMTLAGGTFAKGNFNEGLAGSAGTSTLGVGALTLTATGSTVDFGSGTVGTLSFASFTPGANTLLINNWTGAANTLGTASTDRLIFNSDQTANLSSFSFTGYAPGATEFNLGGGYYEITPAAVPEPATYAVGLLTLFVIACQQRKKWRRKLVFRPTWRYKYSWVR